MKKLLNILILLSVLCALTACEKEKESKPGYSGPPRYALHNKSDHVVAIVQRPAPHNFPDSLVLLPGNVYAFGEQNDSFGVQFFDPNETFESRVIYYDGRYVINFADIKASSSRKFFNTGAYRSGESGWLAFGFANEDFAYIERNGTDLGEPK